jgi:hypothetical protein
MKKTIFLTIPWFLLLVVVTTADVPKLINYQGMLTDAGGTPLNGPQNLIFRIYDDTTGGGTLQWSETRNGVPVDHGLFNVVLGQSAALNLAFDKSYWLEVEVQGEIMPRIRITSVGYAYRALVADSAVVAVSVPSAGGWTDDGRVVRLQTNNDSVGVGTTSPSSKLDVNGDVNTSTSYKMGGSKILSASPLSADNNLLVGLDAGANNTGHYVTFVGNNAGGNGNQGYQNTFLGASAGYWNSTGDFNTFLGRSAGFANSTGDGNTFVGHSAGSHNHTGHSNTLVGRSAGDKDTSGYKNTFVGDEAGYNSTEGSGNVFVGYRAGYNETGSNKLYIANSGTGPPLIYGDFSTGRLGLGTNSPSGETRLHLQAVSDDFGVLVDAAGTSGTEIGLHTATSQYASLAKNAYFDAGGWQRFNTAQGSYLQEVRPDGEVWFRVIDAGANPISWTNALTIENNGEVGIGTTNPGTKLAVAGLTGTSSYSPVRVNTATGDFYYQSSSKRYKGDIRPLEDDFEKILEAQPKSFYDKASGQREIGYIAEEFDEVGLKNLVIHDKEGRPDGLKYELVSLYLLEIIKGQAEMMKRLEAGNEKLRRRVEALEAR